MQSSMELATGTVELRDNTSKPSFEPSRSGNTLRTCFRFVSTFHCRSPSKWKHSGKERIHAPTSLAPMTLGGNHFMPGKPYQSSLIPHEDEILSLRKRRPPVAFARIAELLKEKHQVSIQRAGIFKFVKVRARWRKKENRPASRTANTSLARSSHLLSTQEQSKNDALRPNSSGIERPWLGWQKERPASTGKILTTFTPSNEYNLTRLTPEEAAAYVEQLKREKNGG